MFDRVVQAATVIDTGTLGNTRNGNLRRWVEVREGASVRRLETAPDSASSYEVANLRPGDRIVSIVLNARNQITQITTEWSER